MSWRRKFLRGLGGLLAVSVVLLYWRWYLPTATAADIGEAMLAKQVCTCVYVANRNAADCRADQFPTMDLIKLEVLRDEERVRAWVPGFGERTAMHRAGLGCALE